MRPMTSTDTTPSAAEDLGDLGLGLSGQRHDASLRYAVPAATNAKRQAKGRRRMVKAARAPMPRPSSAARIARVHAVVSGGLRDAVPDLVARNVAADAKLPKVNRKKVRPPTPEAYGALLDARRATAGNR
jgi:hypothetical protein